MKRSKVIISVAAIAAVIIGAAVFVNFKVYNFTRLVSSTLNKESPPTETAKDAESNNLPEVPAEEQSAEPNQVQQATQSDSNDPQIAQQQDANEPNRPREFRRSRRSMGGEEFASGFRNFEPGSGRSSRISDGNQPFGPPGGFQPGFGRDVNQPAEPNQNVDPNTIMEAVNLKDVQMRDIIAKLAEWTGKVIIPTDDSMNQRVTIYSAKKLPRRQALGLIYSALRIKGIVAEEVDGIIYLKPIREAMFGSVPVVPADQPLAAIENKSQVVQKTFKVENYSPSNMSSILLPMIGEHGYISSDEDSKTLLVIDTVENLMRFERIISQFDVPEAEQTVTQVFVIKNGDPAEIVQLLNILLGVTSSTTSSEQRGGRSFFPRPGGSPGSPSGQSGSGTRPATSVVISSTQTPVVLIAEQKQRWIIAKGSQENLKLVGEWIEKLDRSDGVSTNYDTIPIKYADVTEVGDRINTALTKFPGTDIKTSVLVTPLRQAKQIMVFGSKEMRDMVKKLVEEIDVIPSSDVETRTFKLKYSDPEQLKLKLDELYSSTTSRTSSYDSYSYRYGSSSSASSTTDQVKTIAFPTTGEITIIASPGNMEKIVKQIEDWDEPLDPNAIKPRIIELHNTDPLQMAELLSKLFSESSSSASAALDYVFGRSSSASQSQKKIVGALYGQLSFESVPGTKKIIVISKIPEAYEVVESLIKDLDKEESAEVPEVIVLKYADPEDLAVRLNAIFNEPGVTAPIWFRETGLSAYSMTSGTSSTSSTSGSASASMTSGAQQMTGQGDYIPPWSRATRTSTQTQTEQMPISNAIGRVRIIPDPRTKSLLLMAQPELKPKLIEMITKLDQPGKQVLIKAIILMVDHTKMTSLGMQLATDPTSFGDLTENSITALNSLAQLDRDGTAAISENGNSGSGTVNLFTSDISILIDFLVKKVNAKILNQQSLWTKDNEEAVFFKGDNVALQTSSNLTGTGVLQQSFEFQRVGMTLRARPSITPEKNVDMIVNIILAQLTTELVNDQPKRKEMETQTNMIVQDGQTIMLGGILFQQDSVINRKIPLLGDIPFIGSAFQHNETEVANSELIVFITPHVIDSETSDEAQQILKESREKLDEAMKSLMEVTQKNKSEIEKISGE